MARDFAGGSSDRIDCGTFAVVSSEFTMCCWVRADSFNSSRDDRFISKADGAGTANHDWMLGKTDDSGPKLRARANRVSVTTFGSTTLPTAAWFHALLTYSNGVVTLYLNGSADGSDTHGSGNLPNNSNAVYIGNQPTSTSNAPDGRIAEVGIWSRVLTDNEIASLARGTPPSRFPDSLELYQPLGHGSPEPDYSGKLRNGTVTGAVVADHPPMMSAFGFDSYGVFASAVGGSTPVNISAGATVTLALSREVWRIASVTAPLSTTFYMEIGRASCRERV